MLIFNDSAAARPYQEFIMLQRLRDREKKSEKTKNKFFQKLSKCHQVLLEKAMHTTMNYACG
jgi:hypothetical protein